MSHAVDRGGDGTLALLARVSSAVSTSEVAGPQDAVAIAARELCSAARHPLVHAWRVETDGRLSLSGTWSAEGLEGTVVELTTAREPPLPSTAVRRAAASRTVGWSNFSSEAEPGAHGRSATSVCATMAFAICSLRSVAAVIELFCTRPLTTEDELVVAGAVLNGLLSRHWIAPAGERRAQLQPAPVVRTDDDTLAGLLGSALERQELFLVYQPQVSLHSDRITGAEALLRWERPEGTVSPMAFIPLAEATGDIVAIGAWVIQEACEQAARWQVRFPELRPFHLSVNVSPGQFRSDLVRVVRSALRASGLPPRALRLELTETMLIEDIEFAQAVLEELRALGVVVSLDDFGTGYSSLTYFQQLDLDEVKIDRAFVQGLGVNRGDTAIVASVLSLAHALERTVVAEGVETIAQLEHLRTLGCEVAQGYLFSRPMPAHEFESTLAAASPRFELVVDAEEDHSAASRQPTVLVVDDSPTVRELAAMCLTAAGFSVHLSATGADGLAAAVAGPPDALLLDMRLPDMSGVEVCSALRDDPATAGCTIVMLTSADDHTVKADAFKAGADDYIVKPFIPRDLVTRINVAMRRRSRH